MLIKTYSLEEFNQAKLTKGTIDVILFDTLTNRKIMECIQNIGFTYAVISHKTVDLRRKFESFTWVVFEIDKWKFVDNHNPKSFFNLLGFWRWSQTEMI